MIIHTCLQGSPEWHRLRAGKPTASNFDKIITAVKGDLSKQCEPYILELIAGCFCPDFVAWAGNKFTDRGKELEPEARLAFSNHTGFQLEEVGFITRDDGVIGCSPDSLIIDGGVHIAGLEIKCPMPSTHVGYFDAGVLPSDYKQQVHGSMAVTGLNRWHFWSYCPGMQPFHLIVERDDYTAKLSAALDVFLGMYKAKYDALAPRLQVKAEGGEV
jgi:hypothetical protein